MNALVSDAIWKSARVDRGALPHPLHPVSLGEQDLAVLHDDDGGAGHLKGTQRTGDIGIEALRNPALRSGRRDQHAEGQHVAGKSAHGRSSQDVLPLGGRQSREG